MRSKWRVEMLGTLRATGFGQEVARFRTRRVASLLAFLAYHRGRTHPRDLLAEMLWPEEDPMSGRRNLRQTLFSLRSVLEPPPVAPGAVIVATTDSVAFNPDAFETDVDEFEGLVNNARLNRTHSGIDSARRAYRGELLPTLNDDWILLERLRLEDLYLSLLRLEAQEPDREESIARLRVAISKDPFDEELHIELIRRYLDMNEPGQAMRQYRELERRLADVLGTTPSDAAQRLVRGIEAGPAVTGRPRTPASKNRFLGRSREMAEIRDLIEGGHRLVTVIGPAGVGKTRLTTEISERLGWSHRFVPMAERFNAAELNEAILAVLDPKRNSNEPPVERIARVTAGRQTLLVLDNLEQIADDLGPHLKQLLNEAPNVVCLASSRQPVQIEEEQLYPVRPLPLPGTDLKPMEAPSVQLFIDRCRTLRPDLRLTPRNVEAIAAICTRLDGVPLAIEIVAGLSSSLSPTQMLHHFPESLTELRSRRKDVPERHRSLGAAIAWSYDVLSTELRRLFLQLAVFRGSFTPEAVRAICTPELELDQALELVRSLVERSFVVAESRDEAARFSLLATFREFAEERLDPDLRRRLLERHAEFFLELAPPERPFLNTDEQTRCHSRIEREYDNLTAALEHSFQIGDLDRCVRLLGVLSVRWLVRGPRTAERRLIREIAADPNVEALSPERRVQLLRMRGTTHIRAGEYELAYETCRQTVAIAQEAGDERLLASCYSGLSVCAGYLERYEECLEWNQRVLELVGESDLVLAERSYLGMGSVYSNFERREEAAEAFAKARAVSEQLRGGEPDTLIVLNQAGVELDLGRVEESMALVSEALRISKRLEDDFSVAVALTVVARCQLKMGNVGAAVASHTEALKKCVRGEFPYYLDSWLKTLVLLWTEQGRLIEAATLAAALDRPGAKPKEDDQVALLRIREALPASAFEQAWAAGLAMARTEMLELALGVEAC